MSNYLLQQIQNEMEEEAKIDRIISSKLKKILNSTKNVKQVYKQEDCDMILIFNRDNLTSIQSMYVDDPKEKINFSERETIFYFKNKNTHGSKHQQLNYMNKKLKYKHSKHN